jgi:hypothetical protein
VEGNLLLWIILAGYFFILMGSLVFTVTRSWIYALSAFSLQTLGVGLLALQIAPLPVAAAKCIVGWLAVTILAVTISREKKIFLQDTEGLIAPLFRMAMWILVFSSMLVLFSGLGGFFQNPPTGILLPSGFLLGIGLVNLGISEHPLRVSLSLLALLQGFELSYLWVEQSLLVLALLAVMDLSILVAMSILHSYSVPMEPLEGRG